MTTEDEAARLVRDIVGVAEIATMLDVPRTTVSMWDARRRTNGFPAPLERLAMGPVYSREAVLAWHRSKVGEPS